MKKDAFLIILIAFLDGWALWTSAAGGVSSWGDDPTTGKGEEKEKPGKGRLSFRLDYLRKEDAAQREDYARVSLAYETDDRFFNPRGGVEVRMNNSEFLTLWGGDDIVLNPQSRVHLRFNHTRYGEWDAAINYVAAYYSFQWRWFFLAVGLGYSVMNFDERTYWNPFVFTSDSPETRFIYEVSVKPPLWKNRVELDLGLRNYDDVEYHGFDDNGYHVGVSFHLDPDTSFSYLYDRRYGGAFISLPTLVRTTWMVSIEHRF